MSESFPTFDPGVATSVAGRQAPDAGGSSLSADAAESTPALSAARIVFFPISTIAEVCLLSVEEVLDIAVKRHFRVGLDYQITRAGWEIRLGALGEIVGELAVTSRGEACRRLWAWLGSRSEFAAASSGAADRSPDLDAACGIAVAPARPSRSWSHIWEMAHE